MVDSEDIKLEKIKTQELSLEIINLSNTFQQNTTIQDTHPAHTPLIHVHIIILPLLAVHPNIILVPANAPPVIITLPSNDTTLLTTLLLNHVTIPIVVDDIPTQKATLIFNINPLLILLTHLHHLFKVTLLQNPNLKLICTTPPPLLLLHNTPESPLNMLTLLHLQLGLLIYIFSNPVKILRSLLN